MVKYFSAIILTLFPGVYYVMSSWQELRGFQRGLPIVQSLLNYFTLYLCSHLKDMADMKTAFESE